MNIWTDFSANLQIQILIMILILILIWTIKAHHNVALCFRSFKSLEPQLRIPKIQLDFLHLKLLNFDVQIETFDSIGCKDC